MTKNNITYLYISSWIGLSPEAVHFYGELQPGDYQNLEKVKLTRILTKKDVRELRKLTKKQYPGNYDLYAYSIQVGQEYEGFDTKDEIIELATQTYRIYFPHSDILILGQSSICDPQKVLDAPNEVLLFQANRLYEEFEGFEGFQYRRNYQRAEAVAEAWEKLLDDLT